MQRLTSAMIEAAKRELARGPSIAEACRRLSKRVGFEVDPWALTKTLARRGLQARNLLPQSEIGPTVAPTAKRDTVPTRKGSDTFLEDTQDLSEPVDEPEPLTPAHLWDRVRKAPATLEDLAEDLDISIGEVKNLVCEAQEAGYRIAIAHGMVGAVPETVKTAKPTQIGGVAQPGDRYSVGVISDLHYGSIYCRKDFLRDFVQSCYDQGIRTILCPGDVNEGCYRHAMFELSSSGIEAQTAELFHPETGLPELPGLGYHMISGNHDDTFADKVGIDPGHYYVDYFRRRGRNDLHSYGRRGAYLQYGGATIELWHPKKGPSYALSYGLQNHVRDYGVGQKPDILLAGHWHVWVYLEQRGVHALACGTFQGGKGPYSKSLGGAPSIGGTVLSWAVTEQRTIREFKVARTSYFEKEELRPLELA